MIDMDMGGTDDDLPEIMLQCRQLLGGIMGMVIIGDGYRPVNAFGAAFPAGFGDEIPYQVPQRLRAVFVSRRFDMDVKLLEKRFWKRNTETGEPFHGRPPFFLSKNGRDSSTGLIKTALSSSVQFHYAMSRRAGQPENTALSPENFRIRGK
jgi:hypothetical protein